MARTNESTSSPLALSATEAMSTAQEWAGNIGKIVGQQHAAQIMSSMQEQAGLPGEAGRVSQSAIPMIPAPVVSGGVQAPFQLPEEGGGYLNYGQRVSADRTRFVNALNQLATRSLEAKKSKDIATATRDYQILMNAITGYQQAQAELAANPNNTTARAVMAHNANVINQFFSDEKKVKKLKDVLGIDVAFDQKARQKKASKPEGVALDNILGGAVPKTGQTMTVNGEEMQVAAPASTNSLGGVSPAQATEGVRAAQFPPTALNQQAQTFMSGIPMQMGQRQYIPSEAEFIEMNKIAAGLIPDANTRVSLLNAMMRSKTDIDVATIRALTDRDVAMMTQTASNLREMLGNANAWDIAVLKHKDDMYANSIRAMELQLRGRENDVKLSGELLAVTKARYEASSDRLAKITTAIINKKDPNGEDLSQEQLVALNKEAQALRAEVEQQYSDMGRAAETSYRTLQKHGTGFPATPEEAGSAAVGTFGKRGTRTPKATNTNGRVPAAPTSTKQTKPVSSPTTRDRFFKGVEGILESLSNIVPTK